MKCTHNHMMYSHMMYSLQGEAFDKAARILGLKSSTSGGAAVEAMALKVRSGSVLGLAVG